MKKVPAFILIIFLSSCALFQEKGIAFEIVNTSDFPIADVKISTSEKLDSVFFDRIAIKENHEGLLSMKNNKVDGSYTVEYTREDGNKIEQAMGYYSNGSSLNSWIRVEIQNDTTLVKFGDFHN